MPAASFQHSVSIAAPIEMVWDALMRADTWENIGPVDRVWDPVHDGDGILTGYRWSTQVGGKRFEGIAESVFHDAPHRYVIDLDTGEVAGRIEIAMTGGNPATELTVTLDLRTKGVLSSMFFPLIRDAIGSGFPQQIEGFARSIAH
jgi:carbon monoxide dehydrogenase subunit G